MKYPRIERICILDQIADMLYMKTLASVRGCKPGDWKVRDARDMHHSRMLDLSDDEKVQSAELEARQVT